MVPKVVPMYLLALMALVIATVLALRGSSKATLFWCHAVPMMSAWMVLAPTGALIARHAKRSMGMSVRGSALWFRLHVVLQTFAVCLTVIGAVSIVLLLKRQRVSRATFHAMLGTLVILLSLQQLLNGALRVGKGAHATKARKRWEQLHSTCGHMLWLLGVVVCISGAETATSSALPLGGGHLRTVHQDRSLRYLVLIPGIGWISFALVLELWRLNWEPQKGQKKKRKNTVAKALPQFCWQLAPRPRGTLPWPRAPQSGCASHV